MKLGHLFAGILILALLTAIGILAGLPDETPKVIPATPPPDDYYVVVIHNDSPRSLTDVRIFGGGCDEHFDKIVPGDTVERSFRIVQDGQLEFTAHGETANGPSNLDKVIDEHVTHDHEGRANVTVDSDGDVNAFSERGN